MTHHQVTRIPKQTNHVLHLLLTLLTCGAWGFVWAGVAAYNAATHQKVTITSYGPYSPARPYTVGIAEVGGPYQPHPGPAPTQDPSIGPRHDFRTTQ